MATRVLLRSTQRNPVVTLSLRRYASKLPGETEYSNITQHIRDKMDRRLLHQPNHPLNIIKNKIFHFYNNEFKQPGESFAKPDFKCFDDLQPVVTLEENFDSLLTPKDHPSRNKDDSYYLSESHLLRCHMTAHQTSLLKDQNLDAFLYAGDVYRRDSVDSTHYPVFHQLDGVRTFTQEQLSGSENPKEQVAEDLKSGLEQMARTLFGPETEIRWVEAYFPFTNPSWEMEVLFKRDSPQTNEQNDWLEVLGCGLIRDEILHQRRPNSIGWAFGIGLERLAMILFGIPDIRLFWSKDPRFLNQFKNGTVTTFTPFSKFPACLKDITFWIPSEGFTDNTFYEMVREEIGDLIESVELIDHFTHPKTGRQSKCYRLNYRSMERSLTNVEVNELQTRVRDSVVAKLGVELR